MTVPAYRVYISVPLDGNLNPTQIDIKRRLVAMVVEAGLEPQAFGEPGFPGNRAANLAWTFGSASQVMRQCQGAIILGLTRWDFLTDDYRFQFVTEWSHYEGALALERNLPTLMVKEAGVAERGIMYTGGGKNIVFVPPDADRDWLETPDFKSRFNAWLDEVTSRYHVFMGYSSGAAATAAAIIHFLRSQGVSVLDWRTDFMAAGTILDQIERAERLCLGGIFLFTQDDELKAGDVVHAAPRDNVIFETGYFIQAKGEERVLVIREKDAKMPADIGGQIYLSLEGRTDIATIEASLLKFVQGRL